jgi:cell division septation protein DedD
VNSSRRVVRVRVAAALAGLSLALAGCVMTNPPDVLRVTDPGDGRSGQIGGSDVNSGVKLRNFLVVSEGENKPGTLVGAISNQTGKPTKVTLTIVQTGQDGQPEPVGTTSVDVAAGEYVQFGDPAGGTGGTATPTAGSSASSPDDIGSEPAAGRVTGYRIESVPQRAGALLRLLARTADGGGVTIELPILPPVGEYAYLAPSPSASPRPSPTSSPSESATSSPSGSQSPSVDPSGAASQSPSSS